MTSSSASSIHFSPPLPSPHLNPHLLSLHIFLDLSKKTNRTFPPYLLSTLFLLCPLPPPFSIPPPPRPPPPLPRTVSYQAARRGKQCRLRWIRGGYVGGARSSVQPPNTNKHTPHAALIAPVHQDRPLPGTRHTDAHTTCEQFTPPWWLPLSVLVGGPARSGWRDGAHLHRATPHKAYNSMWEIGWVRSAFEPLVCACVEGGEEGRGSEERSSTRLRWPPSVSGTSCTATMTGATATAKNTWPSKATRKARSGAGTNGTAMQRRMGRPRRPAAPGSQWPPRGPRGHQPQWHDDDERPNHDGHQHLACHSHQEASE